MKQNKTFAQRAKDLVKKYKRANFDKNEREELESALAALAKEQETYKQANGIGGMENNQYAEQEGAPEQQQFLGIGNSYLNNSQPFDYRNASTNAWYGSVPRNANPYFNGHMALNSGMIADPNSIVNLYNKPSIVANPNDRQSVYTAGTPLKSFGVMQNNINANVVPTTTAPFNINSFTNSEDINQLIHNTANLERTYDYKLNAIKQPAITGFNVNSAIKPKTINVAPINKVVADNINELSDNGIGQISNTQGILPSVISGIGSIAGNLIQSAAVKPTLMNNRYSAEQVSLANEREALARQASDAQASGMYSLKNVGNRGAYLAGVGSMSAGLQKNLADATMNSYQRELLANMEQRNRAQTLNAQVDQYNAAQRAQAAQDKMAYRSAAIQGGQGAMTDINQIIAQNNLLRSLASQNYMLTPNSNKLKDLLFGTKLMGKVKK